MKTINGWIIAAVTSTAMTLGATSASAQDEEWEFAISPMYVWAKNVSAVTTAGGRELPLELDFQDDILENLDAAFAIHFEARKGKMTLFAEYNYSKLDPSNTISQGPITLKADVDFRENIGEGGITWAIAESERMRWEAIGGLRYIKQDVRLKLNSSRPGGQLLPERLSVGDSWLHPFAGGRVIVKMSERWSFRARADYGYEGSDNTALQGIALFDYRFRDWGSAFFGYRYLDIDFDNGSTRFDQYGFDGDEQGPDIGLNMYF